MDTPLREQNPALQTSVGTQARLLQKMANTKGLIRLDLSSIGGQEQLK
jgi:hypothetical protein